MIDEEYFDKMIQFENDLKNQGWEKRVEGLRMMKEQNKRIELLSKSVKIIDFFPTCKNLINEYSILNQDKRNFIKNNVNKRKKFTKKERNVLNCFYIRK